MTKWLSGEIVEKQQWCEDLFSLRIRTEPLEFSAGQFVNVGLEIDNKLVARPYSLVSVPQDRLLEIHFNRVNSGLLSPRLAALNAGDSIQVSDRANGLLTIKEVPEVPWLWLFATGTGIGPFLSILKTVEPWRRFRKIILCYSVKTLDKLAYHAELDKLQTEYPDQFCFVPLITQQKIDNTIHARITTVIANGELENQVGLQLSGELNHIMLCGNSEMILQVTALLESRGLRRHTRRVPGHIAIEKYY